MTLFKHGSGFCKELLASPYNAVGVLLNNILYFLFSFEKETMPICLTYFSKARQLEDGY